MNNRHIGGHMSETSSYPIDMKKKNNNNNNNVHCCPVINTTIDVTEMKVKVIH
jgi:hypothetical protein